MVRGFLTVVGVAYLALAAWCVVQPEQTAQAVGFSLARGAGQSEYFTVYGGLQTALGLLFMWPWLCHDDGRAVLRICLLIHGCLVTFRSVSFGLYADIPATTYALAATEWVIFLGAMLLLVMGRRRGTG